MTPGWPNINHVQGALLVALAVVLTLLAAG